MSASAVSRHRAPAVSYPVGPSRFQAGLLAGVWLLAALVGALWWVQARVDAWQGAAWLAALALAGAAAWRGWRASPVGMLRWQDAQWHFVQGALARGGQLAEVPLTEVRVVLDLQFILLLWVAPGDPAQRLASPWLWLARADDPRHWHALRRAVYGRGAWPAPVDPVSARQGAVAP